MGSELKIDLEVPDREAGEADLTDRQFEFIEDLCADIGVPDGAFAIEGLGKVQASSLIDQLVAIRDAGGTVTSASSPSAASNSQETQRPSLLLCAGILLMPYIFAWVTLQRKYSLLTKVVSFGWLAIMVAANWSSISGGA